MRTHVRRSRCHSTAFFWFLEVCEVAMAEAADALKVGSKVWVRDKDLYGTVR